MCQFANMTKTMQVGTARSISMFIDYVVVTFLLFNICEYWLSEQRCLDSPNILMFSQNNMNEVSSNFSCQSSFQAAISCRFIYQYSFTPISSYAVFLN